MHTMREHDNPSSPLSLDLEPSSTHNNNNGYLDGSGRAPHIRGGQQGGARRSAKLVVAAVGGMLLPLVTQIGHAH